MYILFIFLKHFIKIRALIIRCEIFKIFLYYFIWLINFTYSLDRIPPGGNATHVVVLRPTKFGYFNFTAAEVSYLPSEDATEVNFK